MSKTSQRLGENTLRLFSNWKNSVDMLKKYTQNKNISLIGKTKKVQLKVHLRSDF